MTAPDITPQLLTRADLNDALDDIRLFLDHPETANPELAQIALADVAEHVSALEALIVGPLPGGRGPKRRHVEQLGHLQRLYERRLQSALDDGRPQSHRDRATLAAVGWAVATLGPQVEANLSEFVPENG